MSNAGETCFPFGWTLSPFRCAFDSLGVEKLPTIKTLRQEYAEVLEVKRKAYAEYKQVREEMRELQNVRANIDYLLGPSAEKTQEKEHL